MPLHFLREGDGSGLDQPYLWQVIHQPIMSERFAAVLGSPITHSRSPVEHTKFFWEFGVPMVAITVTEDQWDSAWPVLANLGLAFAAVTAPLKNKAAAAIDENRPVNTLWVEQGRFHGSNTDSPALKGVAHELKEYARVWQWGSGAMRFNVEAAFPHAKVISARDGTDDKESPNLLIWATGRSREFKWPSETVQPQMVLDLNYTEDSPGLEFASLRGLPYQSGLRLFKLQADLQRQHWRQALELR
jgi:shikimate 5-dehydrogenase